MTCTKLHGVVICRPSDRFLRKRYWRCPMCECTTEAVFRYELWYGLSIGPLRNEAMVQLGADVYVALPKGQSPGTRHCMGLAERAGIPVLTHEVST